MLNQELDDRIHRALQSLITALAEQTLDAAIAGIPPDARNEASAELERLSSDLAILASASAILCRLEGRPAND